VNQFIDAKWRQYNRGKNLGRFRRTDFAIGVIEGFRENLEADEKKHPSFCSGSGSLVKIQDPRFIRYLKWKYPHTSSFSRKSTQVDPEVMNDGVKTGHTLVIAKGVGNDSTKTGLLLESK
jgi:hypothetical protein